MPHDSLESMIWDRRRTDNNRMTMGAFEGRYRPRGSTTFPPSLNWNFPLSVAALSHRINQHTLTNSHIILGGNGLNQNGSTSRATPAGGLPQRSRTEEGNSACACTSCCRTDGTYERRWGCTKHARLSLKQTLL